MKSTRAAAGLFYVYEIMHLYEFVYLSWKKMSFIFIGKPQFPNLGLWNGLKKKIPNLGFCNDLKPQSPLVNLRNPKFYSPLSQRPQLPETLLDLRRGGKSHPERKGRL